MSLQKSSTNKKIFIKKSNLWKEYHDCRDFNLKDMIIKMKYYVVSINKYLESTSIY